MIYTLITIGTSLKNELEVQSDYASYKCVNISTLGASVRCAPAGRHLCHKYNNSHVMLYSYDKFLTKYYFYIFIYVFIYFWCPLLYCIHF